MSKYYGILGIPNINYINKMYNLIFTINDINDLLKLTEKIIFGLKKGYYDFNIFCKIFNNLTIEDNKI